MCREKEATTAAVVVAPMCWFSSRGRSGCAALQPQVLVLAMWAVRESGRDSTVIVLVGGGSVSDGARWEHSEPREHPASAPAPAPAPAPRLPSPWPPPPPPDRGRAKRLWGDKKGCDPETRNVTTTTLPQGSAGLQSARAHIHTHTHTHAPTHTHTTACGTARPLPSRHFTGRPAPASSRHGQQSARAPFPLYNGNPKPPSGRTTRRSAGYRLHGRPV